MQEGGASNKEPFWKAFLFLIPFLSILYPFTLSFQAKFHPVQFLEVTDSAGISFKHVSGFSEKKLLPETMGSGACCFDYNADGFQDLYVVQSGYVLPKDEGQRREGSNVLYRNNGDGTFTDVTAQARVGDQGYGMGCVAGDYDNDGDQDLYVVNFGPNVLYENLGDGTFRDVTEKAGVGDPRWGSSAVFFDYDSDGFLDLYVVNYVVFDPLSPGEHFKDGHRMFGGPEDFPPVGNVFYRNLGNGTFKDVTEEARVADVDGKGLGVVCSDFDNDGDQDIYIANDLTRNTLYQNNSDGTFTDITLIAGVGYSEDGRVENGMGVDFGDLNNDGLFDIIVTNFQGQTYTVYRNDGGGLFTDITFSCGIGEKTLLPLGFGTNFLDYDNDGDQDLHFVNGHVFDNIQVFDKSSSYPQKDQVFMNDGTGHFKEVSDQMGPYFQKAFVGRGSCYGDYDNDGDIDIFVVNSNQRAILLRNDGGNKNHWIKFSLQGTHCNRDAIGARIKVVVKDLVQVEEVRTASSYQSSNDLRVHFGLGPYAEAEVVEIRWPCGKTQTLKGLKADKIYPIKE